MGAVIFDPMGRVLLRRDSDRAGGGIAWKLPLMRIFGDPHSETRELERAFRRLGLDIVAGSQIGARFLGKEHIPLRVYLCDCESPPVSLDSELPVEWCDVSETMSRLTDHHAQWFGNAVAVRARRYRG